MNDDLVVDKGEGSVGGFNVKKCPHLSAGVKVGRLSKALPTTLKQLKCTTCKKQGNLDPSSSLWVCLVDGIINCGTDDLKHAIHHSEGQKTHKIVMNVDNLDCWCYACDDFIIASGSKNQVVTEAQALIRKLKLGGSHQSTPQLSPNNTIIKSEGSKKLSGRRKAHIPGLINLGNTCFFNSVMQCLSYLTCLNQLISKPFSTSEEEEVEDINSSNRISNLPGNSIINDSKGLSRAFLEFLNSMYQQQEEKKEGSINPSNLFSQLGKKYKVYQNFNQQDSHELLRCILGAIKEEQLKKDSNGKVIVGQTTFVDFMFGGKLMSYIVCDYCQHVSYSFEEFLDLSLSICEKNQNTSYTNIFGQSKIPARQSTDLSNTPPHLSDLSDSLGKLSVTDTLVQNIMRQVQFSDGSSKLSIQTCLHKFISIDVLEGANGVACENCNNTAAIDQNLNENQEAEANRLPNIIPNTDASSVPEVFIYNSSLSRSSSEGDTVSLVSHPNTDSWEDGSANDSVLTMNSIPSTVSTLNQYNEGDTDTITTDVRDIDYSENSALEITDSEIDLHQVIISHNSLQPPGLSRTPSVTSSNQLIELPASTYTTSICPSQTALQSASVIHRASVENIENDIKKPNNPTQTTETNNSKILRKSYKRYLIHTFPKVLVLHLKRFQLLPTSGRTRKIDDHVLFEEILDLSQFVSPVEVNEKILKTGDSAQADSCIYKLTGIVVHSGSLFGGHYVSYMRKRGTKNGDGEISSDTWVYASDTTVRESSWEEVSKAQAYLLFYEKI